MNLWIGNLAPEVTDEDLKPFVGKYGCKAVYNAQLRLHGMYWKERRLFVQTTLRSSVPPS